MFIFKDESCTQWLNLNWVMKIAWDKGKTILFTLHDGEQVKWTYKYPHQAGEVVDDILCVTSRRSMKDEEAEEQKV